MITKNEQGEKLFEDIWGVIKANNLKMNPYANELGDEIDTFVELLLDTSEGNEALEVKNDNDCK